MELDSEERKFGSEYAKSDRSMCKLCKSCIAQGTLRLSIYVQSPFFDGKIPNWYHMACFFKKKMPADPAEIRGFDNLRWDDQQKIKQKMGFMTVTDTAASASGGDVDSENPAATLDQFSVEYAKSCRSKCRTCEKRIDKDAIRIGKKESSETWHHLDCFAAKKKELGFSFNPEDLAGFDALEEKDKETCKKSLGELESSEEKKLLKRKASADEKTVKKENEEEEKEDNTEPPEVKKARQELLEKERQLKEQAVQFWKLRDAFDKELHNDDIKYLLEQNGQSFVKTGRDDLLLLLCDSMKYGALEKCGECKNGQLYSASNYYYCTGNITEWTKCSYRTQDPKRREFIVDSEFRKAYTCLKNYKSVVQKRLFANPMHLDKNIKSENGETAGAEAEPLRLPLYKLNFSFVGKLQHKNQEMRQLIEKFGGKFKTTMDAATVAVISNQEEVEKKLTKMQEAERLDIHVVDEAIIDEISKLKMLDIDAEKLILKHNIATWGSDLKARMELSRQSNEKQAKDSADIKFASKSIAGGDNKVKMKVKGGAAVDPDSGLEDIGHILCEARTNEPYSSVLGLVDIMRGTNSYYKLQLIEEDKAYSNIVHLFRAWGRVGTVIGGNKLVRYSNKNEAIQEFKAIYLDKTGNDWDLRKTASKKANKFFPLEIDYSNDEDKENLTTKLSSSSAHAKSESKLDKRIQDIIKLIFDIETMKRQMIEFEIDLNKMPLGKISSNQIKKAFAVLSELTELIKNKSSQTSLFVDASNRFYTLIPHDFGMKKPPILDDSKQIKEKIDMLDSLLDIEIAYNILKVGPEDGEVDPIDVHYEKLKCKMNVLDHNSDEFKRLVNYAKNTHAATHSNYELVVEDILEIDRYGELPRYEKFKSLHNRKLLWHGSRLTNFAGILSQGLRIAPPEAPSTGYMFGKGVYFADMVSKSANYCFASQANPTALMILSEVALGDHYERLAAEYVTKLPDGKHSTKGCGRTCPDPKGSFVTPDGLEIPMGKGVNSGINNTSLLYNEFIVYDVAQIRMKYLLKVKFKYSY